MAKNLRASIKEEWNNLFWDNIGNEIRKNMTKVDFEDLTTISGDDYFELMRYEY